jgi:hypothetical protein
MESNPPPWQHEIQQLLTKQALHELNVGYCRAVDRLDEPALIELFHPDAVIDSGVLRGEPVYFAREFAAWVRRHARCISHAVTNEWFRIAGDRARGECHVTAVSRIRGDSSERDVLTVGRYLDRFEFRAGHWKFIERRFVLDHSITCTDADQPWPEFDLIRAGRGGFAPYDPACHFWAESDGEQ